ncbi:hypothetical protein [Polaribacter cellanae]|uniref:Lipoprotein n=1 Tax=Polaribacter cellanae TaxID=2818493 RepID=A0A975CTP2_9FLAO|nr:hypothetical protein [Polaribacter cellanae]QTE23201.1 hypothetical protein J3359_02685 [Polaribacter cellanae]
MKKRTLLIISIIFFSCKSENQSPIDYTILLDNCLTQNEIKLLNTGSEIFERKIVETSNRKNIGSFYKKYVELFLKEYPSEIIENKEENDYLIKLKKSELFNKIWSQFQLNKIDNHQKKYFELKGEGEFMLCLIKNAKNPKIKDFLNSYKEITGISLQIMANGLIKKLTEKEFNSKIIQLFITIEFYYNLKINIKK